MVYWFYSNRGERIKSKDLDRTLRNARIVADYEAAYQRSPVVNIYRDQGFYHGRVLGGRYVGWFEPFQAETVR